MLPATDGFERRGETLLHGGELGKASEALRRQSVGLAAAFLLLFGGASTQLELGEPITQQRPASAREVMCGRAWEFGSKLL